MDTFFNNGPNILKSIVRVCIYYSKLALLTSNYLLLVMALLCFLFLSGTSWIYSVLLRQWCILLCQAWVFSAASWVLFGTPRPHPQRFTTLFPVLS